MKFDNNLKKVVLADLESIQSNEAGLIPMLLGQPGIGKSSWVTSLGADMGTKVFVLPCNQLADKTDLTGARLVPIEGTNEYKQVFYPHEVIQEAIAYAEANPRETPILFMDEINRTTPDVTSECLSIPTLRSIGSKHLPKNLRVIAAGNDRGNVTSLDKASISRFALYHVEPDVNTFLGLDQNLNPFVKSVLEHHPESIFGETAQAAATSKQKDDDDDDSDVFIEDILDDGEEMSQIATPRTISGISAWLNKFTNDELLAMSADTHMVDGVEVSFLQEVIEGHTGKTAFTYYLLGEIASNIATVNNQASVLTIPKPKCYDQMKQAATIDDLNQFIASMSENEKCQSFVYALHEKAANETYLNALMGNIQQLTRKDTEMLMKAAAAQLLDSDNVAFVLRATGPLASYVHTILSIYE